MQGHTWRTGFQNGELQGVVFDDVPEALERWHALGMKVSSCFSLLLVFSLFPQVLFVLHVLLQQHDLASYSISKIRCTIISLMVILRYIHLILQGIIRTDSESCRNELLPNIVYYSLILFNSFYFSCSDISLLT